MRLLSDPKGAIGEALGVALPASMAIEVHEEDGRTGHLVLPPTSRLRKPVVRCRIGERLRHEWGGPVEVEGTEVARWMNH